MLLPFILKDCKSLTGDALTTCEKERRDLLVLSMALQTTAPHSSMNSNMIAPLLLIDDREALDRYSSVNYCN